MSQNKTVVSGAEFAGRGESTGDSFYDNLYRPSGMVSEHTYINDSGKSDVPSDETKGDVRQVSQSAVQEPIAPKERIRMVEMQERVVVGVLYSISRGLLGEIFPLYLGRNMIGTSAACDQRLYENTVSAEHAVIYIRNHGPYEGFEVTVSDYGSHHGTAVNGEDGTWQTLRVEEEDIISIGKHYKFILKLFNTERAGLAEDPEFEDTYAAVEEQAASAVDKGDGQQEVNNMASNDFYAPSGNQGQDRTVIY